MAPGSSLASRVAICVLSYDGASDLWAPFFDAFAEAWPDCPLPLYLLTNHKEFDTPHRVKSLAIGEDRDWSSNLLAALERIEQDYILFTFDDFIPRAVDAPRILHFLSRAIENDWPYLTLYPNNYRNERVEPGVRRIAEHGIYRCTLVYGVFKKQTIIDLLVPGENAWEFEIESGKRARNIPLHSIERPVFRHYHLLRKGMWMRPGYPIIARRYPLNADRPVESETGYMLRETKEWLFRKYHRWAPPALIERLESRRRAG